MILSFRITEGLTGIPAQFAKRDAIEVRSLLAGR
jgi:hypothetical protein